MPTIGSTLTTPQRRGVFSPVGGPAIPTFPNYSGGGGSAGLDRANIDSLLRGEFDPYEINMESAENAVGGGMAGSGFAQAGRYKLLDSEKLSRKAMGNQMLDPYLNREHQTQMQREAQAAQAQLAQQEAEWAMQRLQASEAGLSARLTQQEKSELEQIILRGNQAMDLERLNQSGNREITGMNIGSNLIQSLLRGGGGSGGGGGAGDPGSRYNAAKYGGRSFRFTTGLGGIDGGGGSPPPDDYWTPSSGGGGGDRNVNNLVSGILRKYGFGRF